MKWISIDTEFKDSREKNLTPVCAVIRTSEDVKSYWHDEMDRFRDDFDKYIMDDYYVISYMSSAEFRFLLSIGYTREDLKNVNMIDIYPMWRMILYGLDDYKWGKYVEIIGGEKVSITTRRPLPWEVPDGEYYQDSKGNEVMKVDIKTRQYRPSLAHACLRMLDVDMQTDHKEKMRDIILYGDIESNKKDILDYCASDTEHLYPLLNKVFGVIKRYNKDFNRDSILNMGKWMLSVACIESIGVPIEVDKIKNFASNYHNLAVEIPTQCNKIYDFYRWENKKGKFVRDYNKISTFIESKGIKWPLTPKGSYSISKKTLDDYEYIFPEIGALKSAMSSIKEITYFHPDKVQKILNNIGSDGRWRGSLMPYGTLTSRCTPHPSEGYIFAMSRWMRNLAKGTIIGADYSAEEIYLQALVSGDEAFTESYLSGDPYTWFATKSKALPDGIEKRGDGFYVDGLKASKEYQGVYKSTRALYKSILLGIGYMMGVNKAAVYFTGAAIDALPEDKKMLLRNGDMSILDSVKIVGSDDEALYPKEQTAQYYLDLYRYTFPTFYKWRNSMYIDYENTLSISVEDGWSIIGPDRNKPQVVNFPIQAGGQVILRKAVSLCLDRGLRVITTLHDAIYIESSEDRKDEDARIFEECMLEAAPKGLRVDVHEQVIDWENFRSNWSEEKGSEEFLKFGKYFLKNNDEI